MQKAWIVVPAGAKFEAPEPAEGFVLDGVLEVYTGESIALQLLQIPKDVFALCINTPPEMPDDAAREFKRNITLAWSGVKTSLVTNETLFPTWLGNCFRNFAHLTKCKPVDQLRKKGSRAIIVGNGPSALETLAKVKENPIEDAAIMACWHSAHKVINAGLKVDYIYQTDHTIPAYDFEHVGTLPFETIFVACHKAEPSFVEKSRYYETYTYLPIDSPLAGFFASAMNCKEHENIYATVVSMMLISAIYAGYEEVILVGVDNGWPQDQPDYPTCKQATEIENQHGIVMKTFPTFAHAAYGLECKIQATPNLKVYQTTKYALDIARVEYKPVEELSKCLTPL